MTAHLGKAAAAFDSLGKALGTFAALSVFFSVFGYFVTRGRLAGLEIEAEAGLSVIPREQIALSGIREVFLSGALGLALFTALSLLIARCFQAPKRGKSAATAGVSRVDFKWRFAVLPFLALLLLLPVSVSGVLAAVTFAVLFLAVGDFGPKGTRSFREFANTRVIASVVVATLILAVLRQVEFPTAFAPATAVVASGAEVRGLFISASSDAIVLGNAEVAAPPAPLAGAATAPRVPEPPPPVPAPGPAGGEPIPALVLARDDVLGLRLRSREQKGLDPAPSLWTSFVRSTTLHWLPEITCFPPECRIDDQLVGAST